MTLKPIDRRWLLNRLTALASVGGAVVFARDTYFAWRRDQREQEKHDLARADRQQVQILQTRATISGTGNLSVGTITAQGSGTAVPPDPTIPI